MPKTMLIFILLLVSGASFGASQSVVTESSIRELTYGNGFRTKTTWTTLPVQQGIGQGSNVIYCSSGSCTYGLLVYVTTEGAGQVEDYRGRSYAIQQYNVPVEIRESYQSVNDKFVEKFGATGSTGVVDTYYIYGIGKVKTAEVCFGVSLKGGSSLGRPTLEPSRGELSCTPVPINPSPVECRASGDINISHGTLAQANVNGNKASTSIQFSCSDTATVKIRLINDKINLGGGIVSNISMNNEDTITVSKSKNLTFNSVLSGNNVTPGLYSGSTIVILNII